MTFNLATGVIGGRLFRGGVFELDAGVSGSYSGSGQTWANTTGLPADGSATADYDFWLGSGSGTDGYEPVFSGVAGSDTNSEYFHGIGSSGESWATIKANTTFINSLHKNNALFSFYAFVDFQSAATSDMFILNSGADLRGVSLTWDMAAGGLYFTAYRESGGTAVVSLDTSSTFSISAGSSALVGLVVDEANGTVFFYSKDNAGTKQTTLRTGVPYVSPDSGNKTVQQRLFLTQDGNTGHKIRRAGMSNVALTEAEFDTLWNVYHARKLA